MLFIAKFISGIMYPHGKLVIHFSVSISFCVFSSDNKIWLQLTKHDFKTILSCCTCNSRVYWTRNLAKLQSQFANLKIHYSKASRYTASRRTDLDNARFWIGSKNTWDARFCTFLHVFARFCTFFGKWELEMHVFWLISTWDARFCTFLHVFTRFCTFLHVFCTFLHVFW